VTHSGPEVLFKTCVAMKFVDDDDGGLQMQGRTQDFISGGG